MVEVSIGVDADEAADGEAGDGADIATVAVDVCRYDEVVPHRLDSQRTRRVSAGSRRHRLPEQDLKNLEAVRQTIIAARTRRRGTERQRGASIQRRPFAARRRSAGPKPD
jgi:hypothetical protein